MGKILAKILCTLALALGAMGCTVGCAGDPLENAKEAFNNCDFETAYSYITQAGDSEEAKTLEARIIKAQEAEQNIQEAIESESELDDDALEEARVAAEFIGHTFPEYPEIDTYKTYIKAMVNANDGELYEAQQKYVSLGDFKKASERADALGAQIEQLYNEGQQAADSGDWVKASINFNKIIGYQDSEAKAENADNERAMDELAKKFNGNVWTNMYTTPGVGNYQYGIMFTGERSGMATISMNASNVSGILVGGYAYQIIGPDRIHMTGSYNTAGNPPTDDFDGDITIKLENVGLSTKGPALQMTPEPLDGIFSSSVWTYAGNASDVHGTMPNLGN